MARRLIFLVAFAAGCATNQFIYPDPISVAVPGASAEVVERAAKLALADRSWVIEREQAGKLVATLVHVSGQQATVEISVAAELATIRFKGGHRIVQTGTTFPDRRDCERWMAYLAQDIPLAARKVSLQMRPGGV